MYYSRYWNRRLNKLYRGQTKWKPWEPKTSAPVPGHKFDPKNKQVGGFKRFERFHKLPVAAWKLYWRQSKLRGLKGL